MKNYTIFTISMLIIVIIINVSCLERKNSTELTPISEINSLTGAPSPYVFITKWGSKGSGDGQFNSFGGIAADPEGNIYVTDYVNSRVQVFDSNGRFITKWGSWGSGDGEFKQPGGIAVNSSGNVYVVDSRNLRIQVFDSKGNFINKWGSREIKEKLSIDSKTIDKLKGKISKDSLLKLKKLKDEGYCSSRKSMAAYDLEHLKFTSKEIELITGFNIDKDVNFSDDIAIDVNGYVYVARIHDASYYDVEMHHTVREFIPTDEIKKFTPEGNLVLKWSDPDHMVSWDSRNGSTRFGSIAVDKNGDVYVSYHKVKSPSRAWIYEYDKTGKFIMQWGNKNKITKGFRSIFAIAVDPRSHIFMADGFINRIHIYDYTGNFISEFGTGGSGDGEFNTPSRIALDSKGNLYVTEINNYRIQKFALNPYYK